MAISHSSNPTTDAAGIAQGSAGLTSAEAAELWAADEAANNRTRARHAHARTRGYGGRVTICHDEPPAGSDSALALRFVERHTDDLRYCAAWGSQQGWLAWDGARWRVERTHRAFDLAHFTIREAAAELGPKAGAGIATARVAAALLQLARADRRLAATADQWDADPWLLNTPDGMIDLTTGAVLAPDPKRYVTKVTGAPVDLDDDCPIWRAFLHRTFGEDQELIGYVQRALGYSLTGSVAEHALFFGYGTGANGKSVLLNTVAGILGDYHKSAPIETFTVSSSERHPTELAGLRGARLVTAVETEEGRRWAESRIKALTGGDTIAARFMRQDFFEFRPQFKLFVAGNHKPGLRSVDEAIRRRFNLIPFAVTIPPGERDPELADRLRDEWPAILAWMIDGCLAWQERGLDPPRAVLDATTAYLEGEDATAAWIDDCCQRTGTGWEPSAALYTSWKGWCERSGETAASHKRFAQALEARGFERTRRNGQRGHIGLRLAGS